MENQQRTLATIPHAKKELLAKNALLKLAIVYKWDFFCENGPSA